jgi:stage II sporulation protein D
MFKEGKIKIILLYVLGLVIITFIIPFLFTRVTAQSNSFSSLINDNMLNKENQNNQQNENNNEVYESIDLTPYNYSNYSTIKVLHTQTNTIEEMSLDEYLYGVVSAEMPVDFDIEALKAQAVVARTYTLYTIINNQSKHGEAQICDDSKCCQAWVTKEYRMSRWDDDKRENNWNKIMYAVNETKGKIITYDGKPINAFFHSNSGGATEAPVNVWGGSGYPYLQTVETSGEDGYEQYSSEVICSKEEFILKIKEKYNDFTINFDDANCIQVIEYTSGGRIKTIKIGNCNLSGVEIRTIFGLKSAKFEIQIDGDNIKFNVTGYGHGVGMSQTGADSLAKQGYGFEDIIKHFYIGVEITNY